MKNSSSAVRKLPDLDRLSVLTAVILLAYVTGRLTSLPVWKTQFVLLGSYFDFQIDIQSVIGGLLAGLTATGANWLFHDHPDLKNRVVFAHILLPSLSSLMIGVALIRLPFTYVWWIGLFVGVTLMVIIMVAEYISINEADRYNALSKAVLMAVAYMIYIAFVTLMRTGDTRLYLLLPSVFTATFLVGLRNFHLRLNGEWLVYESLLVAFIVSQIATALHYWPLPPISYGLLLLGPTYAVNSLFVSLIEGKPLSQSILEPLAALSFSAMSAFLVR